MKSNESRRRLGTITNVSADRFKVEIAESVDGYTLVGFDDQHYAARIGSLTLIPLSSSYVVAEVVGLTEHPSFPRSQGKSGDSEEMGLHVSRELVLTPVGTLPFDDSREFIFGVSEFPPLYSDVLHVENKDLDRILNVGNHEVQTNEVNTDATRLCSLAVGTSVVFSDYDIRVRINEFFGAHSAILGNTGSGKSCTISSLLQEVFNKPGDNPAGGSTFVIFDTNGEYRQAFSNLPSPIVRAYKYISNSDVNVFGLGDPYDERETVVPFELPHWLLTIEEWELLLQASDRAQKPVLRNALGLATLFAADNSEKFKDVKNHIIARCLQSVFLASENHTAAYSKLRGILSLYHTKELTLEVILGDREFGYGKFDDEHIREIEEELKRHVKPEIDLPSYENRPFDFHHLETAIDMAILYEEGFGNKRVRDYCSSLVTRAQSLTRRDDFEFLRVSPQRIDHSFQTEAVVDSILGIVRDDGQARKVGQIHILDLSMVENDIIQVVAAVLTRLIFDQLRRNLNRNSFPVNLVLEEAHRYVPSDSSLTSGLDATSVFERVAREGRKFGLFLMLSSQRPNELSGTVLSQCSNYIIHRIQNPEDLSHIRRMTPFISESVLKRLPSLPKQHALLFGTSVNIPTTLRVRDASPLPNSDNSDVSRHWYRLPHEVTNIPL